MRHYVIKNVAKFRDDAESYVEGKSFNWFLRVNNWFARQEILNAPDAYVRADGKIARKGGSTAVKPRRT